MKTNHKDSPHKYQRIDMKGLRDGKRQTIKTFWKCMLPDCPHSLPFVEQALGALTQCWGAGCENVVQINSDLIRLKKPMCNSCREKRKEYRQKLAMIS